MGALSTRDDLGRNQHHMGDLLACNGFDVLDRIEMGQQNVGAPIKIVGIRSTKAPLKTIAPACMVTLSGVMRKEPAKMVPYHGPDVVGVDDSLGHAGGAAAVHDVERVVIVYDRCPPVPCRWPLL